MSVHDRARRREQRHQRAAGAAQRRPTTAPLVEEPETEAAEIVNISRSAPVTSTLASSIAASNNPRPVRRVARPAPAPVDYSADYRAARTDLRWIALWATLLFLGMIALRFSGLV